jgi:hypothetical protein
MAGTVRFPGRADDRLTSSFDLFHHPAALPLGVKFAGQGLFYCGGHRPVPGGGAHRQDADGEMAGPARLVGIACQESRMTLTGMPRFLKLLMALKVTIASERLLAVFPSPDGQVGGTEVRS